MLFIRTLFWLNFTLALVWGLILQLSQLTSFANRDDIDATKFIIGLFTGTVRDFCKPNARVLVAPLCSRVVRVFAFDQGLERSWFFFSGYGAYSMPTNLTANATILGVQYEKPVGLGLGLPDSVVTTDVWYLGLSAFSMFYSLYFALNAILEHYGEGRPIS